MPGPADSYDKLHQKEIRNYLMKKVSAMLAENRLETFDNSKKDGEYGVCVIKTDGTYQKRSTVGKGYTSKIGVIVVSDALSGKMLDYEVMTSFCHKCNQWRQKLKGGEEFENWQRNHQELGQCKANFKGPSTEMERVAVKRMYQRSKASKLFYK